MQNLRLKRLEQRFSDLCSTVEFVLVRLFVTLATIVGLIHLWKAMFMP